MNETAEHRHPPADSPEQPLGSDLPLDPGVETSAEPSMGAQVARGGVWALTGQVAVLTAALVATPFTIRLLGPSEYGLWALLQSAISYLFIADFGMAAASTRFAADRHAQGDADGEVTAIWSALAITLGVTAAAGLAVALAGPFIVDDVLHLPASLRSDGLLGLRIVCGCAVIASAANAISTPQQVRLRWGSLTLATSGPRVLQIAAAPLLLFLAGGGVVALTTLLAASLILVAVLNGFLAVHFQPRAIRPRFERSMARALLAYGGVLTIASLASVPLMNAERFFLAHFHSTTEVAYYAAAAALGALLLTIPMSAGQVLLPALARLQSGGLVAEHRRLYAHALRAVFLVAAPLALAMSFVARPFLDLWAGPAYGAHSAGPFYLIVAGLFLNTLTWLPYTHLLASGRTATIAKIHLAELAPYLVGAAVLASAYGAMGAAAAWAGRLGVDCIIFFAVVERSDRLGWVPTPSRKILSIGTIGGLGVAFWLLALLTSDLPTRLAMGSILLAVYLGFVWRRVLTDPERVGVGRLVAELFPAGLNPRALRAQLQRAG